MPTTTYTTLTGMLEHEPRPVSIPISLAIPTTVRRETGGKPSAAEYGACGKVWIKS